MRNCWSQVNPKCLLIKIPQWIRQWFLWLIRDCFVHYLSVCESEEDRRGTCGILISASRLWSQYLVSLVTMVTMDRSNMILDYSRGWTLSISRGGWWDSSLLTFAEVNLSVSFNPKIPECWERTSAGCWRVPLSYWYWSISSPHFRAMKLLQRNLSKLKQG